MMTNNSTALINLYNYVDSLALTKEQKLVILELVKYFVLEQIDVHKNIILEEILKQ